MAVEPPRHIFELTAGGPDDPDGSRAATVLSAYFRAERTRALRRLLWPPLAVIALAWAAIGGMSSLLSTRAILAGLMVFGAIAIGAAVAEWRAAEHLSEILGRHEPILRSRPSSFPPL